MAANKPGTGADDLLAGILDEVENNAAEEERRLQEERLRREEEKKAAAAREEEERRTRSEAALREEEERRKQAEVKRTIQMRALTGAEETVDEDKEPDYATSTAPPVEVSAPRPAVAQKKSAGPIIALAAAIVFAVVGVGGYLYISSQSTLDMSSYSKRPIPTSSPTGRPTTLALAMVPTPEPVAPTPEVAPEGGEETAAAATSGSSGRSRGSSREAERRRQEEAAARERREAEEARQRDLQNISLDGPGIFEAGAE
ncbi:MAG: hypothetical protein KC561_14370 [Myxococcales bacterium]|nr:hypothetical protein [Myxococcales bacterium]